MICDDEIDLLNMYKMALQRLYNVIIFDSGKECIKDTLLRSIKERKSIF